MVRMSLGLAAALGSWPGYLLSGELHLDFKSADGWHTEVLKPGDIAFVPLGMASRVSNPTGHDARYLPWLSLPRDPKSN